MYDIHTHVLPGVDDGAKSLEETLKMARVAAANGTTAMLCTPHRRDVTERSSAQYVRDLVTEVNGELRAQGIELELLLGMENHLDLELPQDRSAGKALPMNGSRYSLVELPFFGRPNYLEDVLFRLQLQGVTPVLAHPERIEAIQRDPELLVGFVERGMLSQVTAGSVVGHFGRKVRDFSHSLLRRRLVHILASDTHFADGPRSPLLAPGVEAAAEIAGESEARAMVFDTPRAILEDRAITIEPPQPDERPRRWWRF